MSAGTAPSPAPLRALLVGRWDAAERDAWLQALQRACVGVQWCTEAEPGEPIDVAVVANPPPGCLQGLRGLRLVQSLWAGVDRLLADDTLPHDVPVARMVDPAMTRAMAETALWATLSLHRGFFGYARQQQAGQWLQQAQRRAEECAVVVLGYGEMGRAVAARLADAGYPVTAWAARPRDPHPDAPATHPDAPGHEAGSRLRVVTGPQALAPALAHAQVLLNLLPLTPATRGLIDARLLAALPRGASVVNLARGAHVVEADLLAALDSGHLAHAVLDVFAVEPLPAVHRFWHHPGVTVLPHVAALTDLRSAAAVVADNLQRLAEGRPLVHLVDRGRGY